MKKAIFVGLALMGLAGCQTDQQVMDSMQQQAIDTALTRARFDMNCPQATGTVLSREIVQPVISGPMIGGGVERAQYTVGIEGCGQRTTGIVLCAVGGSGCFSAPGR